MDSTARLKSVQRAINNKGWRNTAVAVTEFMTSSPMKMFLFGYLSHPDSNPLLIFHFFFLFLCLAPPIVQAVPSEEICIEDGGTAECVNIIGYSASMGSHVTCGPNEHQFVYHLLNSPGELATLITTESNQYLVDACSAYFTNNGFYPHTLCGTPDFSYPCGPPPGNFDWQVDSPGSGQFGSEAELNLYFNGVSLPGKINVYAVCPTGYAPNSHYPNPNPYCWRTAYYEKPELCAGNPIQPGLGNKHQRETDYRATGVSRLVFQRFYNSLRVKPGDLGLKWSHSFERSIEIISNASYTTAFVHRPEGKRHNYRLINSVWINNSDIKDSLESIATGWRYTTTDDNIELYDNTGRLLSIVYLGGMIVTLDYDASTGLLATVSSNLGESLSLTYNTSNLLASITDHTGRRWVYRYDGKGNLEHVDAYVGTPGKITRTYLYEDVRHPNALTGIMDERSIRYANFEYDANGYSTASYHGPVTSVLTDRIDGVTVSYDTNSSRTVTDSHGTSSQYSISTNLGAVRLNYISGPGCASCSSGHTSYTYDQNNNTTSRTENSIITKYGNYDSKSQAGCKVIGITSSDSSIGVCAFNSVASPAARRVDFIYDTRFFNKVSTKIEPSVFVQ